MLLRRFCSNLVKSKPKVTFSTPFEYTVDGGMMIQLPLNQKLTKIHLPNSKCTVGDLLDQLGSHEVQVISMDNVEIAKSTPFDVLGCKDFLIRMEQHTFIQTFYQKRTESTLQQRDVSDNSFAAIEQAIAQDQRPHISVTEFVQLCTTKGNIQEKDTAMRYLQDLQNRKKVYHFEHSKDAILHDVILLNTDSSSSIDRFNIALDKHQAALQFTIEQKQSQLFSMKQELQGLSESYDIIRKSAMRNLRIYKWSSLGAICALYGTLMVFTFRLESWDVMEPLTYFIGFTSILGTSFYHSLTKRDATYSNMWTRALTKRIHRQCNLQNISLDRLDTLRTDIPLLEKDINVLKYALFPYYIFVSNLLQVEQIVRLFFLTMRISKMVLQWTIMFTVPSGVALYYFKPPLSTMDQRKHLEKEYSHMVRKSQRNMPKFKEMLLPDASNIEKENKLDKLLKK